MSKWRLITNISFADYKEARIWCHAFLIDMDPHRGFGDDIRQMRGLAYGGIPACTFWIDPKSEIHVEDTEGNTILMSHDGNDYNLGGVIVRAKNRCGEPLVIALGIDNFRGKIVIEDIESERPPFGDDLDEKILPHASGQAYPRVEWTVIPERFKRAVTKP